MFEDVGFEELQSVDRGYYQVFYGKKFVMGTGDLLESYRKMNSIGRTAWVYDPADNPYEPMATYGDEADLLL